MPAKDSCEIQGRERMTQYRLAAVKRIFVLPGFAHHSGSDSLGSLPCRNVFGKSCYVAQSSALSATGEGAAAHAVNLEWPGTVRPDPFRGSPVANSSSWDFWTYCCINCMHLLPQLRNW